MTSAHRRVAQPLTARPTPDQLRPWEFLLTLCRTVSVGVTGTRGVGKSTLLFLLAWLDAVVFDKAMVVICPVPQVIDLFFHHLCLLNPRDQAVIWPKIRYLN